MATSAAKLEHDVAVLRNQLSRLDEAVAVNIGGMFDGALQLLYEGVQVSGAMLPMQQQFAAQVAEAGP